MTTATTPITTVAHSHSTRPSSKPIMLGLVVGAVQAASPAAVGWIEPAILHALYIAFIAAIYIGFAVADGRPQVIAVESAVAAAFFVLASAGVAGSAWLLVAGYAAHGFKDFWQHRTDFVSGTRWWPPFCAAVDFLVAAVLAVELASGMSFH